MTRAVPEKHIINFFGLNNGNAGTLFDAGGCKVDISGV